MEEMLLITYLNDFIFCPVSIYFHKLYGNLQRELYQIEEQIDGTSVHDIIENKKYSTRMDVLQAINVYSHEYNIMGKIDVFDIGKGILTERKNKIVNIYDGYVFQLYAQYYALEEMGYEVKIIRLHSICDNKNYYIKLPREDCEMNNKFNRLICEIRNFNMSEFQQTNISKCKKCIYEPICDRSCL